MTWTRLPRRRQRLGGRPNLEILETRQLLSSMPISAFRSAPAPAEPVPAQLSSSQASAQSYDPVIGAAAVRTLYNVDGSGLTAAVIDTGVNYRHPALGQGFGPGYKVVAGLDYGDGDGDPDASSWQHGTAVAGLIASSDPVYPGVAPGAQIAALRVFGSDNRGSYDHIANALQWVLDNHDRLAISVVNLSISDSRNYPWSWFETDGGIGQRITGLIHQLRVENIPVVSASGNSFAGQQGMGFTAILPETISVTATDMADAFLPEAQRLGTVVGGEAATDLAAPGAGLTAPAEGGSFLSVQGTSFAAPLVSGSILLLQSIYMKRFGALPRVEQVESWLRLGSDEIHDSVTGIKLPRLDVLEAAALVPRAPDASPPVEGPVDPPTDAPAGDGSSAPPAGNGSTGPVVTPPPNIEPPTPPATEPPPAPEPSPPAPAPAPETPPQAETPDVTDAVLAELYRDGKLVGHFEVGGAADPLTSALDAAGVKARLRTVRVWTARTIAVPETGLPTGTLGSHATAMATNTVAEGGGDEGDTTATTVLRRPNPVLRSSRAEKARAWLQDTRAERLARRQQRR